MIRIGFYLADQNPHRDRTLGVTAYTDGLLRHLQDSPQLHLVSITSASSYAPPQGIESQRLPLRTDGSIVRAAVDHLHPLLARGDVDLWHYPKGHLPAFGRRRKPTVGTVHDVILQHYADHYPHARSRAAYAYWLAVLKRSVARFDLILTVSEFSGAAILVFCERHKIKCPPIRVTYEGFSCSAEPSFSAEKKDKVLHLASAELHKRTSTLLRLWQRMSDSGEELPELQLIGNLSREDYQIATKLKRVEIKSRLSSQDLHNEIASARALLLPSEVEGFGLPALEAYALGTPVVYVRDTAVAEILGQGTPGSFVLDDFDSFKSAVEQVVTLSPQWIREHAETLQHKFSWLRAARATVAAYDEALKL